MSSLCVSNVGKRPERECLEKVRGKQCSDPYNVVAHTEPLKVSQSDSSNVFCSTDFTLNLLRVFIFFPSYFSSHRSMTNFYDNVNSKNGSIYTVFQKRHPFYFYYNFPKCKQI